MSRNSPAKAGPGRGTGNRPRQRDQRQGGRRRNFAVTPIVRIAINSVVESFRALPTWAQQDAGRMLVGQNPDVFNTIGPSGGQLNQPPPDRQANIAPQRTVKSGSPTAEADGKPDQNSEQDGNVRSAPKLKGWNRPVICELEFAKRLKNHPSGYSESQRKLDAGLLSAALQAVSRGTAAGATEGVIQQRIASARMSTSSYRRLWPSKKTRKEYALKHAPEGQDLPCVRTVDDEFIVHTKHNAVALMSNDDGDTESSVEDSSAVLPLKRVSFHDPEAEECAISKDLVQGFINGVIGNYSALKQKIHLLNGRIALYWIKGISHSGLCWADLDDHSVELASEPAKSPKRKKRRTSTDG